MKKNKMKKMKIKDGVKNKGFRLITLFALMRKEEIRLVVVLYFSNHSLSIYKFAIGMI